MKAPGTAKRTTFLPFHASVESLVAIATRQRGRIEHRDHCALGPGRRGGGDVRMPHALCSSSSGVNGTWTNTPEGISSPTLTDAIFTVASKWGWRVVGVDGRR